MKERTLVYMTFRNDYVELRTVSRSQKSPHRFYISRHRLEELEQRPEVTVHDIHSFAILHRNAHAGTIEISFTWLADNGNSVFGYQDAVILPYDKMIWSSFFVTLTQNKFHLLLYRFSNGVRYPFEECGRL